MHADPHADARSEVLPRAAAPSLLVRWRARRRARRYYAWARNIDVAPDDPVIARRAARLYQRGLRSLRPAFRGRRLPGKGLGSRDRLEWALAMSFPGWRRSSWKPTRRATVAAAIAVLGVTVACGALAWALGSRNLAAGQPWRASSSGAGFAAEGRIEAAAAATAFMHTDEQERPSLVIDLNGLHTIGAFEIENRRDCCADRTVPLAIETSIDGNVWSLLARRTAGFATWVRHFDPVRARFVRIQVERRSILHLSRVGIYGR